MARDTNKKMLAIRLGDTARRNIAIIAKREDCTTTRAVELALSDYAKINASARERERARPRRD